MKLHVSIHTTEEPADLLCENKKPDQDSFIEIYKKMTEALKASARRDIEKEEELYGD